MFGSRGQECSWASRRAGSLIWALQNRSSFSLPSCLRLFPPPAPEGVSAAPCPARWSAQCSRTVHSSRRTACYLRLSRLLLLQGSQKQLGFSGVQVSLKGTWLPLYGTLFLSNNFFRLEKNDEGRFAVCLSLRH